MYTTAIVLTFLAAISSTAAQDIAKNKTLSFWSQCGGRSGCIASSGLQCVDGPWPAAQFGSCVAGSSCVRQNEWFYQCRPLPAASSNSPKSVAKWGQCGGRSGCPIAPCSDSVWGGDFKCAAGTACVRVSEWYRQCRPASSSNNGECAGVAKPTWTVARGKSAPAIALEGNRIVDANTNAPVALKGYVWPGFNTPESAPEGLWVGGSAAASDFAHVVQRSKLLGFNAVRLSFHGGMLDGATTLQTARCKGVTYRELVEATLDPEDASHVDKSPREPVVALPTLNTTHALLQCNTNLPNGTALDRLLWTLRWFVANEFYVVLTYHGTALNPVPDQTKFAKQWQSVWQAVRCLPDFASDVQGRVILNLVNEPDGTGSLATWAKLAPMYVSAMDAIDAIDDGALFAVQGTGQLAFGGVSRGNGFVTDPDLVKTFGISDASPFFETLLGSRSRYAHRVLLAPHALPPSITRDYDNVFEVSLFNKLNASVGYLSSTGYCRRNTNAGVACRRFPIVVGRVGSTFVDGELDVEYLQNVAAYFSSLSDSPGWFYSNFVNAGGRTGGIVDSAAAGQQLSWHKLRFLRNAWGLKPWWQQ
jgi:hypothetical protein